jgi:hypothetical protein
MCSAGDPVPYSPDAMTAFASFTFVRRSDGLHYHFEQAGERHGRPAYRRTDGEVWCVWSPDDGWHCEIADGLVTAHPLVGQRVGSDEAEPPATAWRSFKNDRSYVYDLRWNASSASPARSAGQPPA